MRVLRIIIGILALVFVGFHLVEMPQFLEQVSRVQLDLRISHWMGKVVALVIGAGVAIVAFRNKQPRRTTR